MKLQLLLASCLGLSLTVTPATAGSPAAGSPITAKKGSTSSRLLLPYFLVDTTRPDGADTFFSVRNLSGQPVDIHVYYYTSDRPSNPIYDEPVKLAAKQLRQFTVSSIPNLLVNEEGFATGYAIIETVEGESTIYGDYYQLNPNEGFASGFRLPDIDPTSPHNDLCSVHSIRILSGGAFDDTELTFWLNTPEVPDGTMPVASYDVYNSAGKLIFRENLYSVDVAFRVTASDLTSIIPTPFGALEIELNGMDGYVTATISALGLYSVGVESACLD